jgi:hypothetical protein
MFSTQASKATAQLTETLLLWMLSSMHVVIVMVWSFGKS